jgi:hypothetical protein
MGRTLMVAAAVVVAAHGVIHLMGTVVYTRLGHVEGLAYKTTLLGGWWDVGDAGISLFGVLWALPAVGFVAAAIALLVGWPWWPSVLLASSSISLALATLDWGNAYIGGIVDVAILAAALVLLRTGGALS